MTYSQKDFDKAIWHVVSQIKKGRVMAYGEVARMAGYPRHARMVSKSMARSPKVLPWHRVLRSNRTRVHWLHYIDELSVSVLFHIKAQCAGNGSVLVKHCNKEVEQHRIAQRVVLSASIALLCFL